MKNEEQIQAALKNVDSRRRGFLTKIIAGGAALPVMSTIALGQPPQGGGKGKGGGGGKGKGGGGKGKGGQGGQQQGRGGMMGDPKQFAARLIEEFDKDGDNALNARELAAALTAMRERRGGQGGPPGQGGQGKGKGGQGGAGKGKGGAGKGKGAGNNDAPSGDVKPKRPEIEE